MKAADGRHLTKLQRNSSALAAFSATSVGSFFLPGASPALLGHACFAGFHLGDVVEVELDVVARVFASIAFRS